MATVFRLHGEPERAAWLLGAADSMRHAYPELEYDYNAWRTFDPELKTLQTALGEGLFSQRWSAGSVAPFPEVIAEALRGLSRTTATAAVHPVSASGEISASQRPRYPDNLSQREVEVLRLLAEGTSNREIAERLVLSERTVERHIANIYARIGVGGRSARAGAAAFALRHGLSAPD